MKINYSDSSVTEASDNVILNSIDFPQDKLFSALFFLAPHVPKIKLPSKIASLLI